MPETPASAPTPITKLRHEHSYNEKLVSELFREVEGGQAWYQLTQGPNGADKAGFKIKLRRYHREVILTCRGRIEEYVARYEQKLVTHGGFLLN